MPKAYYNENDPYAANWLRNLITVGLIAPGYVDDRSITDVQTDDLAGFTQCHFFAGIGVWSYALRLAGWPDKRPVWTGSCPCQPFSVAGSGKGFSDKRHLWPVWYSLVEQCRPPVLFGEQVEAAIKHGWLDLVQNDLEGINYAFGAVGIPAAGVGAPHIRQRLYWVADTGGTRLAQRERVTGVSCWSAGDDARKATVGDGVCSIVRVADPHNHRCESGGEGCEAVGYGKASESDCCTIRVADASCSGVPKQWRRRVEPTGLAEDSEHKQRPGPTNGHWRVADWLRCRDGKFRPVEPGTFPLVDGDTARVGRLRAYGNAIVAEVAKEVIIAYLGSSE